MSYDDTMPPQVKVASLFSFPHQQKNSSKNFTFLTKLTLAKRDLHALDLGISIILSTA